MFAFWRIFHGIWQYDSFEIVMVFAPRRSNSFSSGNCHHIWVRRKGGWMKTLLNEHIPDTHLFRNQQSQGVKKSPFQIFSQTVRDRRRCQHSTLRAYWLAVEWCHEQSYSFCQSPKCVNADWTRYVQSSSGLITTVMMILVLSFISRDSTNSYEMMVVIILIDWHYCCH